jgi:hypothetical protein
MSNERKDEEQANSADDLDQNTVLEQWKFYGDSTHRVSERRLKNNRFYLRLLIALLAVAGIGTELEVIAPVGVFFIGAVGLPFCVLWTFHILSYQQLNSGKYRVLWTLAEELPFDPFKMEWDRLKEGEEPDVYIKHTTVEVWWPRVFGYFYAVAALWGGLAVIEKMNLFGVGIFIISIIWVTYSLVVLFGKSPTQYYWDYTGD